MFQAILEDAAPIDLQLLGRVLIHAIAVGAACGFVACGLYVALELAQHVSISYLAGYAWIGAAGEILDVEGFDASIERPYLLPVLPAIGAFAASYLSRTFAPETAGAGADAAIGAFHQKVSEVRRRVITLKAITTILTLGTGGAGGREGPTMHIGGAIGSTVARYLNVSQRERRILLVAGMAAGTSAIFRTPLGAALLAVEILYKDDFEAEALVPAVLASVVSYSVFISLMGEATLFATANEYPFVIAHLPLYLVMTLLLAAVGNWFVRCLKQVERLCERLPAWARAGLGGLGVGMLCLSVVLLVDPRVGINVLGGGYGAAQASITGADWLGDGASAVWLLLLLACTKMLGASLTIGTGGSAGAFGPSLSIGALVGGAFGRATQLLFDDPSIQPGAFALVGMGTLFGGIAHCPLGALVMVCEMAGSYDLLVPLMLAEGIAFVTMRRTSLYSAQRRGQQDSPAHPSRVLEVLSNMRVRQVMISDVPYASFAPGTPVTQVMRDVSETTWQDVFPVLDDDGHLVGMITPELLRLVAAERELEPWIVAADTMQEAVTVRADDDLRRASERMLTNNLRELPVVDDSQNIVGFIDEAAIGQVYLDQLDN